MLTITSGHDVQGCGGQSPQRWELTSLQARALPPSSRAELLLSPAAPGASPGMGRSTAHLGSRWRS